MRSFINWSGLAEVVNGAGVLDAGVGMGTPPLDSNEAEVDGIAADCSEDTLDSDEVSPGVQGIAADCSGDTPDSFWDVEVEVPTILPIFLFHFF